MPYAPRATLDNPYGPQITFRTEDVLPPTALYISPEDSVWVWAVVTNIAADLYLQIRMLMPTGEIKLIPYDFNATAAYSWAPVFSVPPVEGYILGVQICADNPPRGQCYVSVMVMRGTPPTLMNAGQVLCQGYTSTMNILSYPESTLQSCFDGPGALGTIYLPNVTGAPAFFQPNAYTRWKFMSCLFALTTSATAGNRNVFVALIDPLNVTVGIWPASVAQPPSTTYQYTFSAGGSNNAVAPLVTIGGPAEVWVSPQGQVELNASNLQPGDVFNSMAGYVEEWVGQ